MSYKKKRHGRTTRSGEAVWLCNLRGSSYLIPLLEAALQNGTVFPGMQTVSSWLEMPSDKAKSGEKALGLFG